MLSGKRIAWGNETDLSRMVGVFWGQGAHAMLHNKGLLSASVPSLWLPEAVLHSLKNCHITRTEYSFQCTCSRMPVFCTVGPSDFAFQKTRYSKISFLDASVMVKTITQAVSILQHHFL